MGREPQADIAPNCGLGSEENSEPYQEIESPRFYILKTPLRLLVQTLTFYSVRERLRYLPPLPWPFSRNIRLNRKFGKL